MWTGTSFEARRSRGARDETAEFLITVNTARFDWLADIPASTPLERILCRVKGILMTHKQLGGTSWNLSS